MHQKDIIFFLKNHNSKTICIVIQIIHRKLLKLFLQFFSNFLSLKYFFYNQKLILISENIGFFYQILSVFNFFDLNNLFFLLKKKKQILNNFGVFNTDIQEEKLLQKEEFKKKTYKKKFKKYRFGKNNHSFYLSTLNLDSFFKSKNYLYFKNIFPNNNLIINNFFFNFLFNYFRHYKINLFISFFLLKIKNFFIICFILNFITLSIRLKYFYLFNFCQQYIK